MDSMDEEIIEEYLKRQGISSMQESGPKKVVCNLQKKTCNPLFFELFTCFLFCALNSRCQFFQCFLSVLIQWSGLDASQVLSPLLRARGSLCPQALLPGRGELSSLCAGSAFSEAPAIRNFPWWPHVPSLLLIGASSILACGALIVPPSSSRSPVVLVPGSALGLMTVNCPC